MDAAGSVLVANVFRSMAVDVFDGAMDEDGVRAHHAATCQPPEFRPKYADRVRR